MRRTIALAVGVVAAILVVGLVLSAADVWSGTWKLNVAKSKYSPGPAPKSNSLKIEATDDGITMTTDGVDAQGPTHTQYAAKFDGKDYPITGNPNADMLSVKKVNDHEIDTTWKKGGKTTLTIKTVVSQDGKTRTSTSTGTDAQGRKVSNVTVYDKQ